ncbi:MAG TPA: NAD-dependent epimerase/dehydratase family protein [Vicinamibacterales bacterium]|nr:NAD-dependent epimerase/dehydratase family protein [Vicinamibacterales bacterium]
MDTSVLLTGASGFLGYHVAKKLNESGVRPRVLELRDSRTDVLNALNVERCSGALDDAASVRAACSGVGTLLHLAFKVSVGGGATLREEMERVNVAGTRQLLETAAASGVRRAVVAGSALAVGVNKQPQPLDESADWAEHAFNLPYALNRRKAELDALALASPSFAVMTVCPSFTLGPDDPVGAPANKLVGAVVSKKLRFTLPVGFGALDVRDFASGVLLAAERGRSGQRYLLSGDNVTVNQLFEQVAGIAGVRAPRLVLPTPLVRVLVGVLQLVSSIRGKPAPVTQDVLQIIGRYAWYDTSKARTELGWSSRPLRETLTDTIRWGQRERG